MADDRVKTVTVGNVLDEMQQQAEQHPAQPRSDAGRYCCGSQDKPTSFGRITGWRSCVFR